MQKINFFILLLLLYIMEYYENFQKLLKQMNDKKIDWSKKNNWEIDIENSINNNIFIKYINNMFSFNILNEQNNLNTQE